MPQASRIADRVDAVSLVQTVTISGGLQHLIVGHGHQEQGQIAFGTEAERVDSLFAAIGKANFDVTGRKRLS